ncbi:aminotransferase class IV family protein [Thalassovita sp.]|uniref:aminotransferase class IV family protein n=1 Tax=Thalassovita sp. TaxID=1979401 RepID=UPI002AB18AA1|nr:aminotransferase class IV family protein [Thalassovita sp.]
MEKPFCPDAAGHRALDPKCRLIETFRYVPGQGMHDLSRHLRRLERSARALGFVVDRKGIERQLTSYAADETMRCRLTVGMVGDIEFEAQPLAPLRRPWRVAIADQRIRSDDWRLQHKTTQRELYDQVRSNLPEGVDELLFLNERDEICEGTITNVFVRLHRGGEVTPPLSSGCLPGVLRQRLLDKGRVKEQIVTLKDLRHAQSVTVGNSLRGEIAVEYLGPMGPLR